MNSRDELLPCPFCGLSLQRFGTKGWSHPKNGCFYAHVLFTDEDIPRWNQRTTLSPAPPSGVADGYISRDDARKALRALVLSMAPGIHDKSRPSAKEWIEATDKVLATQEAK